MSEAGNFSIGSIYQLQDRKTLGRQELQKLRHSTARIKEEAGRGQDLYANAFDLLKAIEGATRGSDAPVALEQLRDLHDRRRSQSGISVI